MDSLFVMLDYIDKAVPCILVMFYFVVLMCALSFIPICFKSFVLCIGCCNGTVL